MSIWFTEKQTPNVGITCKVNATLHVEQTPFQHLSILETEQFGRMLVLDGMVMTTSGDEFVYHEMIAHVPLFAHPNPQQVLIIGGGDGGTLREVAKHPAVQRIVMVEIDARVVETSRQFLPELSSALDDARAEIRYEDGIVYAAQHPDQFDVILVDSTEPIGPAAGLFSRDFYQSVFAALKPDGLFCAQTESPFFNRDLIRRSYRDIADIFPIARLYLGSIPTYPSGLWSFTIGSKQLDPVKPQRLPESQGFRYYTPELHQACFTLPKFVSDLLLP